jgi:hypothetical protein
MKKEKGLKLNFKPIQKVKSAIGKLCAFSFLVIKHVAFTKKLMSDTIDLEVFFT